MKLMNPDDRTIFVVDDDEAMRDALGALLRSVGLPVQAFGSAKEFLEEFDPERAGCVLLDVRMPGMSGLDLQRLLGERYSEVPILLISGHADVPMAVEAMKRGAIDFIEKPIQGDVLLDRVRKCLELDAERRVASAEAAQMRKRLETLTAREREVSVLIAEGLPNKTIAAQLGISTKTLDVHRSHILSKLGLRTNAELVRVMVSLKTAAH